VRLGSRERALLLAAPSPAALTGLAVEAPEKTRAAQQAFLRAAAKLARHQLLFRRAIVHARRVDDPRRHHPRYARGRFWVRTDPTRRHWSKRIYVWATPLGEGIGRVYARELRSGQPIRWTAERISMARSLAERHPSDAVEEAVRHMRAGASAGEPEEPGEEAPEEFVPEDVAGPEDYRRWRIAVETARRWKPNLGSEKLLKVALQEYAEPQAPAEIRRLAEQRFEALERRRNAPALSHRPLRTPFS
jgi:hypothetical protein